MRMFVMVIRIVRQQNMSQNVNISQMLPNKAAIAIK